MWSLTSPRAERTSGPENFVRQPEKTFATVSVNHTAARAKLEVLACPSRHSNLDFGAARSNLSSDAAHSNLGSGAAHSNLGLGAFDLLWPGLAGISILIAIRLIAIRNVFWRPRRPLIPIGEWFVSVGKRRWPAAPDTAIALNGRCLG